jgi:hypothetical protein
MSGFACQQWRPIPGHCAARSAQLALSPGFTSGKTPAVGGMRELAAAAALERKPVDSTSDMWVTLTEDTTHVAPAVVAGQSQGSYLNSLSVER